MVDILSVDPQELGATVGRSKGVVLMSPPNDSADARTTLAALASAIKPGTKVRGGGGGMIDVWKY